MKDPDETGQKWMGDEEKAEGIRETRNRRTSSTKAGGIDSVKVHTEAGLKSAL